MSFVFFELWMKFSKEIVIIVGYCFIVEVCYVFICFIFFRILSYFDSIFELCGKFNIFDELVFIRLFRYVL